MRLATAPHRNRNGRRTYRRRHGHRDPRRRRRRRPAGRPRLGAVAEAADGRRHRLSDISWATLIPNPRKIICVGLNYRNHIVEMGRDLPEYPTLFAKYPEALIGANDDIAVPQDEPSTGSASSSS